MALFLGQKQTMFGGIICKLLSLCGLGRVKNTAATKNEGLERRNRIDWTKSRSICSPNNVLPPVGIVHCQEDFSPRISWGKFPTERLNPQNGLCLSTLHDAAFDAGLITLDEKLSVVLSKRLRSFFPQPALERNFVPFEGAPIRLPEKLAVPDAGFLRFHREEIFQS